MNKHTPFNALQIKLKLEQQKDVFSVLLSNDSSKEYPRIKGVVIIRLPNRNFLKIHVFFGNITKDSYELEWYCDSYEDINSNGFIEATSINELIKHFISLVQTEIKS